MAKSIAKNYIYNVIYQILVIILPIVTIPYLSRVLGADNIGISSYTTSIATYFILFGSLGVGMYAQREIAYVQDDVKKRSKIFFEIIILRFITMAIAIVTFYIAFASNGEYELYYKILLIQLISNCFDISWFFQGQEEFKKVVIRNIIVKFISIAAIFIFVKTVEDLWIYMVILACSEFFGNLTLWFYLPKFIQKVNIKELEIFKHFVPILACFVPQIAIQVYTILDRTMLGALTSNMAEVGIYDYSQRIVKMVLLVVTSLGTVVAPRIANNFINGKNEEISQRLKNSVNFVWFLGIPLMFGLIAISSCFVGWFFGEGFEKMDVLIMVGSLLIISLGLNNVTGMQYLMPVKKQNVFTISVIIGAITNCVLNFILIRYYGALGAIIASVVAETVVLLVHLIYMKDKISMAGWLKCSIKYWIAGILMLVITLLINERFVGGIYNTALQVIVGIGVYFGVLYLLKDEFFFRIVNSLKDKVRVRLNRNN